MGRPLHCFQDCHGGCGLSVDKKNVVRSISENTVISLKPFAVAAFSILAESHINQGVQRFDGKYAGNCNHPHSLKCLPGAGYSGWQHLIESIKKDFEYIKNLINLPCLSFKNFTL